LEGACGRQQGRQRSVLLDDDDDYDDDDDIRRVSRGERPGDIQMSEKAAVGGDGGAEETPAKTERRTQAAKDRLTPVLNPLRAHSVAQNSQVTI